MSDDKKGILTVISGFSGAGKGTVVKELLDRYPDRYRLSISATTRAPRDGEKDGVHYFFKSREEFEDMIEKGEFLEHARFVDNYYGTPREYVEKQLQDGYDVILEIEQQGAFQVKKSSPKALLLFITPPTIEELERRLRGRGTETEEVIISRLERAAKESEAIDRYDYFVINEKDKAALCAEQIHDLIESARCRIYYHEDEVISLQKGLEKYRKED